MDKEEEKFLIDLIKTVDYDIGLEIEFNRMVGEEDVAEEEYEFLVKIKGLIYDFYNLPKF